MTDWTPEQTKEHRRLWVEALRSGKYEQGRYGLRDLGTGGYCCLGVACAASGLGKWDDGSYIIGVNAGDSTYLPAPVTEWLGLASDEGRMSFGSALYQLNDTLRKTFSEIADIIESEPEGLLAKHEASK